MQKQTTLIIGANSEIAKALAKQVINNDNAHLIVVSRNIDFYKQAQFSGCKVMQVDDYTEATIKGVVEVIWEVNSLSISKVFICHGLLHNQHLQPEKRLSEFCADAFTQVLTANTITPMLWIKSLVPLLCGKQECKIVVFSARVGRANGL